MVSFAEPTLRTIKEEMRLAIACAWLVPDTIYAEGEYPKADLGILTKFSGHEISKRVTFEYRHFYGIRNLIEEKYAKDGYREIARNARKQVTIKYVETLLRKYKISLEESKPKTDDGYSSYSKAMWEIEVREHYRAQKARKNDIVGFIMGGIVICLALFIFGVLAGWFSDGDDRTNREKRLDEICAANGHSGCSKSAREIKRISEQYD